MNALEIALLIHQALIEIQSKEVMVINGGELPDGSHILVIKLEGRIFNITIEEEVIK